MCIFSQKWAVFCGWKESAILKVFVVLYPITCIELRQGCICIIKIDSGRSTSTECDVEMILFTTIILGLCSLLLVTGASPVVFLIRELLAAMPNHNIGNNGFAEVEVW